MEVNDFLISIFDCKNRNFFLRKERKGEFHCKPGILFAKFDMHECSGQIRRHFRSCFRSLCLVVFLPAIPSHRKFFPPVTVHDQQFGLHCSHRNFAFQRYQPWMLLATSNVTLIQNQTASSPIVLLLLPTNAILLLHCCHRCVVFRTFLSAPNILWNAVLVFVVVTSACRFTRVILLSLFSFMLLPVASVTGRSSQRSVLRSPHSMCVKEIPCRYAS